MPDVDTLSFGPGWALHPDELELRFIRASGPGGQNVNKVSTAVQLRFDLKHSPSMPDAVKSRAARAAGQRLTLGGEILITADRFRTQELNRRDAIARLLDLLDAASVAPRPRKPTRPTMGSKVRRLDSKAKRSGVKAGRGKPRDD